MNIPLGILDFLGPSQLLIFAALAVLLFGERLPEVAQSIGKQFKEFRNSLQGIQNEFKSVAMSATNTVQGAITPNSSSSAKQDESEVREEATAPKFVPPSDEVPVQSHDETVQK